MHRPESLPLVERLRRADLDSADEAADRIEQLETERDRFREALQEANQRYRRRLWWSGYTERRDARRAAVKAKLADADS